MNNTRKWIFSNKKKIESASTGVTEILLVNWPKEWKCRKTQERNSSLLMCERQMKKFCVKTWTAIKFNFIMLSFLFNMVVDFTSNWKKKSCEFKFFLASYWWGSEFSSYEIELRKMVSHFKLLTRVHKILNWTSTY